MIYIINKHIIYYYIHISVIYYTYVNVYDYFSKRTFNFDPRVRNSFWNALFNGIVLFTGFYGCNQTSVQRYLSLRSKLYRKM